MSFLTRHNEGSGEIAYNMIWLSNIFQLQIKRNLFIGKLKIISTLFIVYLPIFQLHNLLVEKLVVNL